MSEGQRFVIGGLSRLTVRVASLLAAEGADVLVLASEDERGSSLARRLVDPVRLSASDDDPEISLGQAGIAEATCLLALSDDDIENLRLAVACRVVAPDVPVVLRASNSALVDGLEGLNIRRAYSVSGLAAPAFVAAALSAQGLETMRIGEVEVPICRMPARGGSPLGATRAADFESAFGCAAVARTGPDGAWTSSEPAAGPPSGGEIVVGGPVNEVLRLAMANDSRFGSSHDDRRRRRRPKRRGDGRRRATLSSTLLPISLIGLAVLLVLTVVVFGLALHLGPADAIYAAVNTVFGSPSLTESDPWLKVFGVIVVIIGGALIGIFFSWVASVATVDRIDRRMNRRADRLVGHVVVAGLGTVGYRVERILFELGIPSAVIDRAPDTRFVAAVGERTPVLTGDVRLKENLERAGIDAAACLIACTDDDLANVEACLQARSINPGIRTVARVFDETLADRVGGAFGIDVPISASRVAAAAFIGAATDERALRPFRVGDLQLAAARHRVRTPVSAPDLQQWRARGVRVLATKRKDEPVRPPSAVTEDLAPGDTVVVAGPPDAVRDLLAGT